MKQKIKAVSILFLLLFGSACNDGSFDTQLLSFLPGVSPSLTSGKHRYVNASDDSYSVMNPGNRNTAKFNDHYLDKVQPILSNRCVACHSCTAGPCQLNLTSYEGLARGMSKDIPYDYGRLFKGVPKADLDDNFSVAKWRSLGFYPIVKDLGDPDRNEKESILTLALDHGQTNHILTEDEIRDLGKRQEDQKYECPIDADEYSQYKINFPLSGMPFGCPNLEEESTKILKDWVRAGSPGPSAQAKEMLSTPNRNGGLRERLEIFLNGESLKSQVTARYLYEHSFTYDISFKDAQGEFYRMVRSRTPAPEALSRIITEFPTDAPGSDVKRVYYRLEKMRRVIEMKKHVLWRVNAAEIDFLEKNFLSSAWAVAVLPAYTNNPFEWFQVIPARVRADYVLKFSKHMIHAIGRGSVCHGREASHVVPEYVWALSVKPESDPTVLDPKLGLKDYDSFYTHPSEFISESLMKAKLKRKHFAYARAFAKTLKKVKPEGLALDDIHLGEMFFGLRHETSMEYFSMTEHAPPGYTKYKILHGYADFEKSYYRQVAHFKWWGAALHKAESYMSQTYSRSFGENFWASLSGNKSQRRELRSFYSSPEAIVLYGFLLDPFADNPTKFPDSWTYQGISEKILERYNAANQITHVDNLNNWPVTTREKKIYGDIDSLQKWESGLRSLTVQKAPYAKYVPNVMHIRLEGKHLYTIFSDRAQNNNKIIKLEKLDRRPNQDQIRAVKGFVGPFPHIFIDIRFDETSKFLTELSQVNSKAKWLTFINLYKVKKNSDKFWPFVDWLHGWIGDNMREEGGILDLRNYDLRDLPY